MRTGVLVQELKWLEHEVDHSNPSITEIMNKYSYASTPLQYAFRARTG
jgi:hypothetical protein